MNSNLRKAILHQDMAAFYAWHAMNQMMVAHDRPNHWERESFKRHAMANQRNAAYYSKMAREQMGIE